MCVLDDVYHTRCGHWGARRIRSPCASQHMSANLSFGCWTARIEGAIRMETQCASCVQRAALDVEFQQATNPFRGLSDRGVEAINRAISRRNEARGEPVPLVRRVDGWREKR